MAPLSRCMRGVETGSACGHLPCRSDRSFCPSLNCPGVWAGRGGCRKHGQTFKIFVGTIVLPPLMTRMSSVYNIIIHIYII